MAAEVGFAIYEGHLGAVLKVFVYYTICEKRDRSDEFYSKKISKKSCRPSLVCLEQLAVA